MYFTIYNIHVLKLQKILPIFFRIILIMYIKPKLRSELFYNNKYGICYIQRHI